MRRRRRGGERRGTLSISIKTSQREVRGNVSLTDRLRDSVTDENFCRKIKYKQHLWRSRDRKSNEKPSGRIVTPFLAPLQSKSSLKVRFF